jgi:hypothetical protein
MTTITAHVLKYSAHPLRSDGAPDLVTFQLRYPRFIHAEAKTHRRLLIDDAEHDFAQEVSLMDDSDLSRNASSSRAIPIKRMLRDVMRDPAAPVEWGSNRPGMQAGDALTGWRLVLVRTAWFGAMWCALAFAWLAMKAGAHKQVVNRIIEPWSHISVIVTGSEWANFFTLRCHPDADPTMRVLAETMRDAMGRADPTPLYPGQWHLPYIDEKYGLTNLDTSAARCARVSYLTHGGLTPDRLSDAKLAATLAASRHMSPFEHQATPIMDGSGKSNLGPHWHQYRSDLE